MSRKQHYFVPRLESCRETPHIYIYTSCDRLMTRLRRGLGLSWQSLWRGVSPLQRSRIGKKTICHGARVTHGLSTEQLAHARSTYIRHVPLA